MSIVVVIDCPDGSIKKASREAVSFAKQMGAGDVAALVLGEAPENELAGLGANGAAKVIQVAGNFTTIQQSANAVAEIMDAQGADTLVLAQSAKASAIGGRVAVKLGASMGSNVVALPDTSAGYKVKTSIFSGKAFAHVSLTKAKKVLVVSKNVVDIAEDGSPAAVEQATVAAASDSKVTVTGQEKATGDILLTDADIVVSAGRGLKGPENWGMIEELAKALGAATGCSKPVSDMDWRPHSEHVGQTGIKVAPTLYIAIGISGAIQHLAGVNSSKYIVVINTDEDAPFFKAADYGIVGDAFEIVPKLTEAIKAL